MTTSGLDLSKWRLVPVEATEEMARRFIATYVDQSFAVSWRAAALVAPPALVDLQALVERNAKMEEALRPFARMNPQTLFTDDPTNQCGFVAVPLVNDDDPADFTGADLSRARAILSEAP